MSVTHPANEYEELVHIVERISRRFPGIPESELFDLAAEELERFDGARLRAYVPVLIEGRMLRELRGDSRRGRRGVAGAA